MVRRERLVYLIYPALFAYLVFARTHNVTQQFWLLSDQVRDWRIAMGPFADLPWVGTPSLAGGTTWGPIYYWVLWCIRVTLGPFYENLPHAGAIGLSAIQSAADVFLCYALAARLRSLALALAIVLFAATSPYDMALSAMVWNPPLAVALSKITIAVVLLPRDWSVARACIVVTVAWLSIQAHMGSLPVAAACAGWMIARPFFKKDFRRGLVALRAAVEIVVLLQLPYVFDHLNRPAPQAPTGITSSVTYTLQHPGDLRIGESTRSLAGVMPYLLFHPFSVPRTGLLLTVAALLALWLYRRESDLLIASIGPLPLIILIFAFWRGRLGEHYWYLPVVPSAVLMILLPLASLRVLRRGWIAEAAVLLVVLALQPVRCDAAWRIHRFRHYGALVRGSRQIARQVPELRAVVFPFLPQPSDPSFLYEIFGGRLNRESPVVAIVDEEGHVRYQRND